MTRQLATIRTVSELIPIEGADRIELAKVDGWQCVVKKGDFAVGDLGLYFEIDSVLPADDARFAFLEPRKFRIKSMKLRGALSQGLLMPIDTMLPVEWARFRGGEQLQDVLGVQKYEPPLPISGEQAGTFPTHLVPKTDQERIQNMPEVLDGRSSMEFEITEKLDGTSCTFFSERYVGEVYGIHYKVGVCSRNWEMKVDDDNVYAKLYHELEIHGKLRALGRQLAVQGEIIGPRIQGNKYKRAKQEFYVFDIYDIDRQEYVRAAERMQLCATLGLNHVPVPAAFYLFAHIEGHGLQPWQQGDESCMLNLDLVLQAADGESMLHKTPREGLVFKHLHENISFKAISNKFLLKTGD